jgi:hypothetical protein
MPLDTLKLPRRLEAAGFPAQQAGELGYFQHRWAVYGPRGRALPRLQLRRGYAPYRPVRPLDVFLRQAATLTSAS